MKIILRFQSSVALHVSGDDVIPERGLNHAEVIKFVGETYQFSIKPQMGPNIPAMFLQNLVFQSGLLVRGEDNHPIIQLALVPNGDIATASTTDIAGLVLDDLMAKLDEGLGFRYKSLKNIKRTYLSNLVVEFDRGLSDKIEAFQKIESLLSREMNRPSEGFGIKKLAFGSGDVLVPNMLTLETMENSDFSLERRQGAPYSENRYFCSAPVPTTEHIRILELLEREID